VDSESKIQTVDTAVYSREFNGTPARYLLASILTGLYLGISIALGYGLIRYYFLGDASVFSFQLLLYTALFLVVYIPLSYRIMLKYDGLLSSGNKWAHKKANVTLIELKEHRRFG
jgi:ABC-type glycerol-3-phosphate transport system permease component